MFSRKNLENSANNSSENTPRPGFDILSRMPSFSEHIEQLLKRETVPKLDKTLQRMYNDSNITENGINGLLGQLQEYNITSQKPALASGQSSYFNKQIDANGFNQQLRLKPQDAEDAKFIAECFGVPANYGENGLPVLYTTVPGSTELNYAMQTFPAGIYEDVFGGEATHAFPVAPVVGESESDYWHRVLAGRLEAEGVLEERQDEALARGDRLIGSFCSGKNRVYFIPIQDLKQNKASFGDVDGLRDGSVNAEEYQEAIAAVSSLDELSQSFGVDLDDTWRVHNDANFNSEYGIAIYGEIDSKDVKYMEVDRAYDIIQKRAIAAGYKPGDVIPEDLLFMY